jgi:hypothetical protein
MSIQKYWYIALTFNYNAVIKMRHDAKFTVGKYRRRNVTPSFNTLVFPFTQEKILLFVFALRDLFYGFSYRVYEGRHVVARGRDVTWKEVRFV